MKIKNTELGEWLIPKILELTGCESYLELGIATGRTINDAARTCKRCIGVDINDMVPRKSFEFHKTTTDNFFKGFNEKVDAIFIDADHHFDQVKKDFASSLRCLNSPGIIFMHDTDPSEAKYLDQGYCGDSYKMHDWIKSTYPGLNIITLPIGIAGITIVMRDGDRRVLRFL